MELIRRICVGVKIDDTKPNEGKVLCVYLYEFGKEFRGDACDIPGNKTAKDVISLIERNNKGQKTFIDESLFFDRDTHAPSQDVQREGVEYGTYVHLYDIHHDSDYKWRFESYRYIKNWESNIGVLCTSGRVHAVRADKVSIDNVKKYILRRYDTYDLSWELLARGNIRGANPMMVCNYKERISDGIGDDVMYKDEKEFYKASSGKNAFLFKKGAWHLDGSHIKEIGFA